MLPTTSSDPEGFRRRPIAFWKALEPLSKAYISTSTLHCDLRISNGHTACGCEQGYRRRRGIDGAAETDVAEAGAYGHPAPGSLAPTLKVASVKSNDLKSLRACSHHPRAFPRAQNPPHAIGHFEALTLVLGGVCGVSTSIALLDALGSGSGEPGPAEQPEP